MVTGNNRHERPMTVDEWVRWAASMLRNIEDPPQREARGLMAAILGSPSAVVIKSSEFLDQDLAERFSQWVYRRRSREPFHLITGEVPFRGLLLSIRPGVLIPRPETEILVEEVASRCKSHPPDRILDLGGGSGAIICALLSIFPESTGVATDVEKAPIACMAENREKLGFSSRLHLLRGDWDEPLSPAVSFDLIVSNPPYIPSDSIGNLMDEVRLYEPHRALDGGADGLFCYRRILGEGVLSRIRPGGLMAVEIGAGERWAFESPGPFCHLSGFQPAEIISDWSDHARVVIWKRKDEDWTGSVLKAAMH